MSIRIRSTCGMLSATQSTCQPEAFHWHCLTPRKAISRATRTKFWMLSSTIKTCASAGLTGVRISDSTGLMATPRQEGSNLIGQQVDVDRFLDITVTARGQASLAIAFHHVGRHGDDRDMSQARHQLDTRGQLGAVQLG